MKVTLTPEEQLAVDAFLTAAKALPKSLCIDFESDPFEGEPNLSVRKRTSPGSAQEVATLRKKSLGF